MTIQRDGHWNDPELLRWGRGITPPISAQGHQPVGAHARRPGCHRGPPQRTSPQDSPVANAAAGLRSGPGQYTPCLDLCSYNPVLHLRFENASPSRSGAKRCVIASPPSRSSVRRVHTRTRADQTGALCFLFARGVALLPRPMLIARGRRPMDASAPRVCQRIGPGSFRDG